MINASKVIRRVAIGCLPVFVLVALAPTRKAYGAFSIFDALTSTITGIGTSITGINSDASAAKDLQTGVVFPVSDLGNIQGNGQSIVNSYRSWMGTVYNAQVNSAQTQSGQALEQKLLSGNGTAAPQISNLYTTTYGSLPTATQATNPAIQAVDMGDANSKDALQLAVMSDSASASSIQVANQLETQALSTSAGSAPQIEATALAYEVESMGIEHKLLAAELRSTASSLAYHGALLKRGALVTGNGMHAIFAQGSAQ